ncbi:unnamed protein product [Parnassius mnemosyne]|uniref:Uncharacterized protein n=1 Tax=Parnassius mnemosyne TaxID=213953 RepID=A0AAV1LY08_9NEOP
MKSRCTKHAELFRGYFGLPFQVTAGLSFVIRYVEAEDSDAFFSLKKNFTYTRIFSCIVEAVYKHKLHKDKHSDPEQLFIGDTNTCSVRDSNPRPPAQQFFLTVYAFVYNLNYVFFGD